MHCLLAYEVRKFVFGLTASRTLYSFEGISSAEVRIMHGLLCHGICYSTFLSR